jgi:hypothetical protein
MPRPPRVRSQFARKRRAIAVIAAMSALALATPAGAQPGPTQAVLKINNAKTKPVAKPDAPVIGLKGAIRYLTREFVTWVRGPDQKPKNSA